MRRATTSYWSPSTYLRTAASSSFPPTSSCPAHHPPPSQGQIGPSSPSTSGGRTGRGGRPSGRPRAGGQLTGGSNQSLPWTIGKDGGLISTCFARLNLRWAVLRIHDILGWIRIRIWIRGSMLLTNGSGSGFCYFRHLPSRDANKKLFFLKFFLLISF